MNKSLTLNGVLESFRNGLAKEASEEPEVEEALPDTDEQETKTAAEAEVTTEAPSGTADTADAEALKGIAKEAMDAEAATMQKEAGEFGKLFAHSFIQEVEQDSMVKQAHDIAYQNTIDALENIVLTEKLAEVATDARITTLVHLAKTAAYNETINTLEKAASAKFAGDLPLVLAGITQEAYDETVKVLTNAQA